VKYVQIAGGEGREMVIIWMDNWESKVEIMRRKEKLGNREIYIDNDLSRGRRGTKEIERSSKR